MESGVCFVDQFNPQRYVFVNKSRYHLRFDFFVNGAKMGIILLPARQSGKLKQWLTSSSAQDGTVGVKRFASEVGKKEYFLLVSQQKNGLTKWELESYQNIKCTIYLDQRKVQRFIRLIDY